MKNLTRILLLAMTIVCTSTAISGDKYWGIGYHTGTVDANELDKAKLGGIKLKIGQYIQKNLAIEGHLLLGVNDDTITYLNVDIETELKRAVSIFIKGDLPLSDSVNLYGLLGYTKGKFEASALGSTSSGSDNGLSYGAGVEAKINNHWSISGEYIL